MLCLVTERDLSPIHQIPVLEKKNAAVTSYENIPNKLLNTVNNIGENIWD